MAGGKTTNPLVAALAELDGQRTVANKIELIFGDDPDVLASIISARRDRHVSVDRIAMLLSKHSGQQIGGHSVKTWLAKQGVE